MHHQYTAVGGFRTLQAQQTRFLQFVSWPLEKRKAFADEHMREAPDFS